jgi:hypothetical protein
MSEDKIRMLFRRADASLGSAPPDFDATIRQAKRDAAIRRGRVALGSVALVAIAVVAGFVALRPNVERVTPAAPGPTIAPSRPCGDIPDAQPGSITTNQVQAFVDDFMQRRVNGSGAEPCMSADAAAAYRGDETYQTGLCLYACADLRVAGFSVGTDWVRQADANSFEAEVLIRLSDGARHAVTYTETYAVGPGATTSGDQQALVIRGVQRTAGFEEVGSLSS